MPKVGRVMGINNATNIPDAQRLFNKLKGRLNELQGSVALLDARIEEAEKKEIERQEYERKVMELYSPPNQIGSGERGGGGVIVIPDSDKATGSSTIVSRSYTSVAELEMGVTVSYADWVENWYPENTSAFKEVRYYGILTGQITNGEGEEVMETVTFNIDSAWSEDHWLPWDPNIWEGVYYITYSNGIANDDKTLSYGNETGTPDPPAGWALYPNLGLTQAGIANGLPDLIIDNADPNDGWTADQLILLNKAKNATWESDGADLVTTDRPDLPPGWSGGVTGTETYGTVDAYAGDTGGFDTDIKIRSSSSLGSNVDLMTVRTKYPSADGTINSYDEVFDKSDIVTSDWINTGIWPTKGQPTNSSLVTTVEDILYKK